MKLEIISPEKELFSGEARSVTLPGTNGSFTILDGHAPIIALLQKGILRYNRNEKEDDIQLFVEGGFVEGKQSRVRVCVD